MHSPTKTENGETVKKGKKRKGNQLKKKGFTITVKKKHQSYEAGHMCCVIDATFCHNNFNFRIY